MAFKTKRKTNRKSKTLRKYGGYKVDFSSEAVYKENIYSNKDFNTILKYASTIKDSDMSYDPKATGRAMYVISNSNPIISTICSDDLINQIRKITGNKNLKPCLEIPIEYRKYVIGSYMDWHKDTKMLPDQLQYECVITLTNNSDSYTLLEYNTGIKKLITKPNSLLVVRANGINHKVTPLTKGTRTILKIVFSE
jgi:hypothetical protein